MLSLSSLLMHCTCVLCVLQPPGMMAGSPPRAPGATATQSLPPLQTGGPVIVSLTPQQFEATWMALPESGAFDCGVSQVRFLVCSTAHLCLLLTLRSMCTAVCIASPALLPSVVGF